MLRVLIADDEPSVVESLKASVDWEKYDLQVAAVAHNGKEARELLETTPIDIAILDIRMPGYSGLELCQWLHERGSEIQIIVISGYAEFSYAQKALHYGVAGYCLKPVEYSELTFLLLKAVRALEKRDLLYTRCDRFLDAFEAGDEEAAAVQMREMGLDPSCTHVAVSIGDQPLSAQGLSVSTLRLGRGQYAYLSAHSLDPLLPKEGESSEQLLGVGALKKPVKAARLRGALEDCAAMAYQFFVTPGCLVCRSLDDSTSSLLLTQLTRELNFSNREKVLSLLSEIGRQYASEFNIRSALQLCNLVISSELFPYEKNDYYLYDFKQLVTEYKNLPELTQKLQELLSATSESGTPAISNSNFFKLLKFVNAHYMEDISLSGTAAILHMNPNYVSQMFRRETGETFTRYVTDLRITQAKKLLRTKDSAISDIALSVGFNDYFYFLKTFKKITGKTPSQWRLEE